MQRGRNKPKKRAFGRRRVKPWDPLDLIESLESRLLLTGAYDQALLAAIDSALTSPSGLTAFNSELKGSAALGTNVAVVGSGMSAYDPGAALAPLLSRLGTTQYTTIPALVSALQNGTGVTVLSTSDLLNNIELNVQFMTTTNASILLDADYGVTLLDPQTLTMPTTLTEDLTLGAYWDPTIAPSGAAVFYVDADASTIQVSSGVSAIGGVPVIPVSTAGQQITISGGQAGNYVLAIQTSSAEPPSVQIDGVTVKTTLGSAYDTPVVSLAAGTHTIAMTPGTGTSITSANLIPQSGAQLGFLQTSGGVKSVSFSPTFTFVLNDQPPVDSAESAGRLTLAQLLDTPLANLVSTQVTQSAPATVTASLSTPVAPGANPIVFTWSNVLAPASVTSTLTTDPTLTELNELQAVNPTTLALGLDEATGDLDAAATTTMLSSTNPFDTTLPLLGVSLDQLIDFTETTGTSGSGSIFQQALTDFTNPVLVGTGNAIDPFYSDQQLISLIDGAGDNSVTESANGTQLLFDLNMSIPFSSSSTTFAGIGSANSQLNLTIPSAIDPNFKITGTIAVQMTFGEDTSTGNFFVVVPSTPNVTVSLSAAASLSTFDTNETPAAEVPIDFGGLGIDAGGPLSVTPQASITLFDPQTDNPPTPGIITANELTSGMQPDGTDLPVPATTALSGTASANLSISVDGSNNLGIAPATLSISWPNVSNPTTDTVNTAALSSYLAWNDVTPANMSNGLSELKSVLSDLPSGSALGQVAGLFDTSLGAEVNLIPDLEPLPTVPNFQSPTVTAGTYVLSPTGSNWGFYNGNAGISSSTSSLAQGTSNAPSGQVGFIEGPAQITTGISNWTAGTYTLNIEAAQSPTNSTAEDFEVLINNTVVGTIDPANSTYANYPLTFAVPNGSITSLTFQGTGSGTVLLGNPAIAVVSSQPTLTSIQSMYAFLASALGSQNVTLTGSGSSAMFELDIKQTYTGNLAWSVEHPVDSEADFSASGSVPATVSYLASVPLGITLSSTQSAADPFYIGGGTDFTGSVSVGQSSLSGSAHLGNLSVTYAGGSMSASDTFSLPLGSSSQQISMETLLSHPQSYFGKLAFSAGASLAFPITGGLPSPGSNPRINFTWSNLGQPSSVTETDSNLGNISSAVSYNDQGFINGVTALNTEMGTWQSSEQMSLHLPWIDQTFEGVIPYISDFQSVFTQIESLNPSSASALDNDIRNTLTLPSGATITATSNDAPANNDFEYTLSLNITNEVINFPFAAGAGFDSLFSINAQVHVTVSFSGSLTFGFTPMDGFYVDGYSGSGNPQMSMTVNIGGTNGQDITAETAGKFGNLPMGVGTASNPAVILLNATSSVNLTPTGDNGMMISTTDLAQDGPSLIQPSVSGTGSLTLPFGMQLGATASTYQANAGPGLISIFYANWNPSWAQPLQFYNPASGSDDPTTVNSQSPTNPTNAANGFGDFYFDTGEFLTDLIGPYLKDIQQFNPIPPQLLSALNYNIPVIDMTPLDLLESYLGDDDSAEGDGVDTLMQIATLITDLPTSTEQLDLSQYIPGAPATGDAGMVDGGLDDDLSGFQDTLNTLADYDITFPVFSDPHAAIAQTLLNVPTTLIEFKPGNNGYVSYTASYNTPAISFPVFDLGILSANATFSAGISATLFANIDIGLTTRGLLGQGIGSGGTETGTPNLLDGFFIGDDTFGGDGTPYQAGLEFEGYVSIGGSLELGGAVSIASISGSLGPEGTLGVIVNDLAYTQTPQGPIPIGIANYDGNPAGDGKAYLDELSYIASNYGPLCAVMPVASLGLNLSITATVGDPPLGFSFPVYSHDFVIANWNVPCTPVPTVLATISGNTLTINPNINSEVLSTSNGANNISAGVWYNTTTGLPQGIVVTESNKNQIFSQDIPFSQLTGVTTLVVNGTEGDDTFNIDPNLTEPNFNPATQQSASTIQIQYFKINTLNGNDTVDLSNYTTQNSNLLFLTIIGGTGTDHFAGNYCPDLIELGSGQNFAYIGTGNGEVIEGTGDDAITGGNGNDTVVGGDGEASIALGDGNNIINQGTGQDQIRVGNGQNLITSSSTVYNSGIAANGSALTSGNPPAPNGNQVAFIQGNSAIAQTTSGWVATANGDSVQYQISLSAAQRATGNNGGEDFEVFIDDSPVGIIDPTSTTYQTYTTSTFTVTAGPHLITLRGLDTAGGNNMAFVDNVSLILPNGLPGANTVPSSQGGPLDGSFEATTLASGAYLGNDIAPPSNYLNEVVNFTDAIPEGGWTYIAGIGTDAVDVGNGQNTIYADPGGSTVKTGVGQDIIYAGGAGTQSITCGGGNDFVSINLDDVPPLIVPAGQGTPVVPSFTINGGSGNTLLDFQGNGLLTLKNGSLVFGPTASPINQINFSNISSVALSGEGGAVSFDVSQWTGTPVQISGGGGTATIISSDDTNFTLNNSSLTRSDGTSFALNGVTVADLTGGASNNTFTVTGWTGTGTINGNGGTDTLIAAGLINATLSTTQFQGTGNLQLVGISQADLTTAAGGGADLNASAFTGNTALFGQANHNTLMGGSGSDYIVGGPGTNNLLVGNGATDNELIGGTGSSDTIDGGAGQNTLVSSNGGGDTITTGSGNSHVYTPGSNNTIHAEGGNAIIYNSTSGNTVDTGSSTTDQALTPGQLGTIASDFVPPATTDLWVFPANPVTPAATLPTGTATLGQWVQLGTSASGGGVSSSPVAAIDPSVVASGSGASAVQYVAWADERDGNYQIYVATDSSTGWAQLAGSAQGGGISNSNSNSLSPSIALNSAGNPIVAWIEAGNIYVAQYNSSGNGSWGALGSSMSAGGISNTGDASDPQIVYTANGPVVAWLDTSGGVANVFVREFNGSSWATVGTGSASGKGVSNSSVAVPTYSLTASGSTLALAWTQNGTSAASSIYLLENTGSAWTGLSGSSSGTGISGTYAAVEPSVAIAGGVIYAAWAADTDGTNNIVAAENAGSAWQSLSIQTPSSAGVNQVSRGAASDPVLAANGSSVDLVWIEDRLPNTPDQAVAIYANRLSNGAFVDQLPGDSSFDGILGRSTSLSSPTTLSLSVDGSGHPFVAWGDSSSGSSQVYMLGDTLNVAKTIYVNDATGPDDTYTTEPGATNNTGLTPNSPLASISAALALATAPGDVILVDSGSYLGFSIGSSSNGVLILGSPSGSTQITGPVSVSGGQNLDLQSLNFAGGLTISGGSGLELNGDVSSSSSVTISGGSNLSLNNDNLFGLNINGAASTVALTNSDLTGTGLAINGSVTGLSAIDNQISSIDIAAASQGAITGDNIDGGPYGGGLFINASFTGAIDGNFIHGAVVGVTYNAAAALNDNEIFHNHTGIIVSQNSGGLGFLAGSTPNYIVDNGTGVKLLGLMQGQYIGGNDIGVTGSGVLGGSSLALANQIESNTTGINFSGTIQDERIDDNGTSFVVQNGNIISDNLIYDNGTNLETLGASTVEIVNDSFYSPTQNNIEVDDGSSDVEILNDILWTGGGYDIYVDSSSRTGFFSDYNDLYTTGSGQIVYYLISFDDILDWQDDVALYDLHSIGTTVVNPTWAQPEFVNLGFGDFNVFPTAAGNRASSPTIGTGDPESDLALPPALYANQLANASFENGTTGWTVNPGATTQSGSPAAFDGSSYLYSGDVAAGYAYQTISLAADSAAIDAGTMDISFGGRIRSSALESLPDQGQLVLTFFDGSGNVIGSPIVVSASNTTNRWELVSARVHIPEGARSVTYRFQSTREPGNTDDDSYLDAAFLYVLASNIATDIGAEGTGDDTDEDPVDEKIQLESPDLYVNWTANQSHNIQWTTFGNTGDAPVRIDVYQETNGVLNFLTNITPSTADDGSYAWIPEDSGLTNGTYYGLKIVVSLVGESAIKDISTETFTVPVTGSTFYVNDGSTSGDQYSTAAGNNRNTGLLPSSPLPLITTLFRTYTLGAGDTVYVDTGTYGDFASLELSGNPAVGNGQGVNIVGPTNGHTATIDALGFTSPAVIDVNDAQYVTLSNLTLADANYGLWVRNASSNITVSSLTVTDNLDGGLRIESNSSSSDTLTDVIADNNTGDGIYVGGAIVSITNSTSYSNTGDGFDLTDSGAAVLTGNIAYQNTVGLYVANSVSGTTTVIGNTNLALGLGNQLYNNSEYGIYAQTGNVLIAGNTVYGQTATNDAGIVDNTSSNSITTENIVYNNYDGIRSSANSTVTDNLAYDNSDFGLFGGVGASFTGNVSYNNGVGIRSEITPNAAGNISSIDNNLVYDNSVQGIWMTGGRDTSLDNNTVYQPLGDAMLIDAYSGLSAAGIQVENNILWTQAGYDISLAPTSESGFKSDYNDLYVTGNGAVGFWETVAQPTLQAWQASSGQDPDSLSANPLFVNTGVDFHEQSLNGSFHGGTLAPILNASTGLPQANPGVLTSDPNESPAIDRGDPTFSYSNEPQPNGGFINLGAYGDTAQASLSPTAYVLILQPTAGETLIERQNLDISWRSQNTSGTVNIELMQNGTPVLAIASGATNSGSYDWAIPTSLTPGSGYTISVTLNSAPTATGLSGAFTLDAAVTSFYVNGSSTGGIFTTAGGNDANSGLDPAHPKATIQGLLSAYQLGAGDTIFVDEGTYNLSSNIVLTSANSGLTIEGVNTSTNGSGPQTILNRDNTSSISYDIDVQNAANVTIKNMTFGGGYYGINAIYNNGSSTDLTVSGCTFFGEQSSGIYLNNSGSSSYIQTGDVIENNVFHPSAAEPTLPSIGTQSVANQGNYQVTVSGWGAGSYALEFSAAQQATGNNGGQNFEVLVDNTIVATIDPTSTTYQQYTTNEFTVGAGSHVIEFLGLDTAGGSNTALVQGLQFTPMPSFLYGLESNGDQITVSGNTAYSLTYGIYVSNGDSSTISGNTTYSDGTGIAASTATVTGNISYNNTAAGLNVTAATLSGNTTYNNAGDGIVIYSGTASGNVTYGNPYGIAFEGTATASDNLIYNNTTAGISGANGATILGNVLYGNKLGMTIDSYPSGALGGPVIENNLIYDNTTGGIYMLGGDVTPILNNTIYQTAGVALQVVSAGGGLTANNVTVRDNIIWDTAGADVEIDPAIETDVALDYNDLYFTGTGSVGVWGSTPAATLSAWQSISEQDADSISTDPLFVNTGVDFHEQSLNGSFHGGTLAPILNTTTGLPQANPGTLTDDANESPAIDRGDPTDPYSSEPAPNGGYVNLGAYGDSIQASLSPAHYLFITNPVAGLSAAAGQTLNVKWRDELTNTGAGAADTDTLQLLTGNNTIVLTASVPDTGSYTWSLPSTLTTGTYQVKVIRNDGSGLSSTSGSFTISAFNGIFYVNGASTAGVFTTAGGNDANSGLDPAHPKATIAAIFSSYTMQPGDVIMVDEATYSIPTNLVLTAADSGITIEGVSGETILNRGNLTSGAYVFDIQGATNVTLENLSITGALYGINASYNEIATGLTVTGCDIYGEENIGINLQGNNGAATITNNTIDDMLGGNSLYGIETNGTDSLTVTGNTIYGGMVYGIYVSAAGSGLYTQVISNNTVYGVSTGIAAGSGQQDTFTVNNNTLYDNWTYNLSVSGGLLTASGNTLYEDGGAGKNESTNEVGVLDSNSALITANTIYGNHIGVELSSGNLVGNTIYNNSTVGVDSTTTADIIRGNTIYSNGGWGISGEPATVANNLIYGNTSGGIELGNDYDAQILNNTIYQTTGPAFQLVGLRQNGGNPPSIALNNNIFWATSAPDLLIDDAGELSFTTPTSDYNDLYATGSGEVAQMGGVNFATLSSWQWELGLDTHSISADPQFINAANSDFHVQSSSPTIDAGNPSSEFLQEPQPNGGRVNLGYDGDTAQAAPSPTSTVQVLSPSASQKVQVGQPTTIQWMTSGLLATQAITEVAVGDSAAVGEYHASEYAAFTTSTSNTSSAINTSLVTNPAPQAVYQNYAYAAGGVGNYLLYNIPVPNGTYTIRLDWAEPDVNSVGGRTFDIILNGQTVQSAFDVYAAAGDAEDKAVARTYTVTATGGTGISLELKNDTSNPAILNAFEIYVANSGGTANQTVNVQVSLNNGNTWSTIATNQPLDTEGRGSYVWTPTAQTSGYTALVRVVANNSAATTGMSDGPFLVASPGTAFYVSNSTTTTGNVFTTALGNNANSGTSPNQPMASIEAVLNDYQPGAGDTIYVDNGTYALFHNIDIPAADSGVTIEGPAASSGATAILNRGNTNDYVFSFVSDATSNVTIENLSITGAYIGINAPYSSTINSITIANNLIYSNTDEGILTGYNSNWTVTGNSIHNNGYYGVYLQGTTATVTNNTVYNELDDGIFVSNPVNAANSSVFVSGNTVYGDGTNSSGYAGIYVDDGTISNNLVHDNGYVGIYADSNSLVTGNTVWRQTATNAYGIIVYSAFVTDNVVFGNYNGILAENAGGTIDGNRIYSNTNYGLLISNLNGISSSNGPFYVATAYGNLIYANSGGGISISGTTVDFTLRNNTVYQLAGDAVNLSASNNATYPITIENNILWVQAGYDLDVTTASETGLISNYNILYHTGAQADVGKWNGTTEATLANWQSASSLDAHSSEANPLFVDPAGADAVLGYNATANNGTGYNGGADDNFFVAAGSPAIAAGNSALEPPTDLLGYPYTNPDIGAYAYRGVAADSAPPTVVSTTPSATQIVVVFSQPPNDIDAQAPSLYTLVGAGTGGSFTASNAIVYTLTPVYQTGTNQVTLIVNGGPLPTDLYQLTIESNSTASVHNLAGVALDGNDDGVPGGNYVTTFNLSVVATTAFGGLNASSIIAYGAATATFSGIVAAGDQFPPSSESVAVKLNGVTINAPIGANGAFSATFNTSTLPASATPYQVTYSYVGDANFAAASASTTLTVAQVTPTITWASPVGIAYGTALSGTQLDATSSVPGTFVYTPTSGVVLNPGSNQILSVTFTPTDSVDYSSVSDSVLINVSAPPPTVTGITPTSGPAAGGTSVTINGTNFNGASAVDFGTTPATSFTVNSTGTQITVVDPAGSGTVNVTVVTAGGTSATSSADQFTYTVLPSWLAASSAATWNASTNTLTVTGAATIIADPGSAEPNIVASGTAAKLTIAPTTSPSDIHIGGITLTGGASIVMSDVDASQVASGTNAANHHSDHNVLVIGTLGAVNDPTISIDSASKLDLGDNDLIVHTGSSDNGNGIPDQELGVVLTNELKAIEALAAEGRNVAPGGVYDGTWTGNGLTSSAAATADSGADAGYEQNILAVEQNSDMYLGGYSKWTVGSASETLGPNDIIVKYTYNGDLNLDGAVDGNAATIFDTFYDGGATSGDTYAEGDLNGDGKINGNDATIFSTVYGNGLAGSGLPQL